MREILSQNPREILWECPRENLRKNLRENLRESLRSRRESKGESKGEPKEPHHIRLLGYQLFVGTCEISDTRLVCNEIFCFLM